MYIILKKAQVTAKLEKSISNICLTRFGGSRFFCFHVLGGEVDCGIYANDTTEAMKIATEINPHYIYDKFTDDLKLVKIIKREVNRMKISEKQAKFSRNYRAHALIGRIEMHCNIHGEYERSHWSYLLNKLQHIAWSY